MDEQLLARWHAEEDQAFQGWDFHHLHGRWQSEQEHWDYRSVVDKYRHDKQRLLDMGTGGGEFLLTLGHPYQLTTVTEAYPPNIRLCQQRLTPLGIKVVPVCDDAALPLSDETFDLIINRHESYDIGEIKRLLTPGGLFITQQVGADNDYELSCRLIGPHPRPFPELDLKHQAAAFRSAGFTIIEKNEARTPLKFYDVGALVFFAKIITWEFPGFRVDNALDQLNGLQHELETTGSITGLEHRLLIAARKDQ